MKGLFLHYYFSAFVFFLCSDVPLVFKFNNASQTFARTSYEQSLSNCAVQESYCLMASGQFGHSVQENGVKSHEGQ